MANWPGRNPERTHGTKNVPWLPADPFFPGYALRKIGRTIVTPVFILTIADLEDLSGFLGEYRLSDVLQEHWANNEHLVHAFGTLPHPLLQADHWKDTKTQLVYRQFTDEITKRIFPREQGNWQEKGTS